MECVLFDFDGVIVDSERYAMDMQFRIMRECFGTQISEEDAEHVIGFNLDSTIAYFSSRFHIPLTRDAYLEAYGRYESFYDCRDIKPIEGCRECLSGLRALGYVIGLVSSSYAKPIVTALDTMRLLSAFDFLITGDMVKRSKPDPEPYLRGFDASLCTLCYAVEDSPAGIHSAKAAGLYTIGLRASSVKLDTECADITIDTYKELLGFFSEKAATSNG